MSLEGRPLPPAEIDCKWWKQGYCARGTTCYFRHDKAIAGVAGKTVNETISGDQSRALSVSAVEDPLLEEDDAQLDTTSNATPALICSICLETPSTFGLLLNCTHVFCLECIRNWRSSANNADNLLDDELRSTSKTCPLCRSHSGYIIPSSHFPSSADGRCTSESAKIMKQEIVDAYLSRLKNIPCRYFEQSVEDSSPNFLPMCKFGNDCHYAHNDPYVNAPYIFSEEELRRMSSGRRRRRRFPSMHDLTMLLMDAHEADAFSEADWVCEEEDEDDLGFDFPEEIDFELHSHFYDCDDDVEDELELSTVWY